MKKKKYWPSHTLTTLMNSCVEGRTGEWDAGSDEGRKCFEDMYDHLRELADHFDVDVSPRNMP